MQIIIKRQNQEFSGWYWKRKTRDKAYIFENNPPLLERPADLTLIFIYVQDEKAKYNLVFIYSHIIYLCSKRVPSSSILLPLVLKQGREHSSTKLQREDMSQRCFTYNGSIPSARILNQSNNKAPIGPGRTNSTSTFSGEISPWNRVVCVSQRKKVLSQDSYYEAET